VPPTTREEVMKMFDRDKLSVSVCHRSYGKDARMYVAVYLGGNSILVSDDYPPGPELLEVMDRVEVFVRHVMDGVKWETAYFTAFPT
jgi:hypothetical protein